MSSLIAWLDSTPEEQKAARELIALFNEQESRDELGIGPIRDAFSDLLFPGTSVLQTRARYFLFIPWCYTTGDAARLTGKAHRDRGRLQERQLIKTLQASPAADKAGLIGARVGVNVQNLPSDLYWNGMRTYGIRTYAGAIGTLNAAHSVVDGATELVHQSVSEWNRTVPGPPPGFPESVPDAFALTYDEASWLRERMSTNVQGSLLAHLLDRDTEIGADVAAPWEAAEPDRFEPLHHARLFSAVMHGAALLYNLIIGERSNALGFERDEDPVERYTARVTTWTAEFLEPDRDELTNWDLPRMWQLVRSSNPNVHPNAVHFVDAWIDRVVRSERPVADASLRSLVETRERRKGTQSRLKNDKMLAAWSGASGTSQLLYRWGTVRPIVNDVLRGLSDAGT